MSDSPPLAPIDVERAVRLLEAIAEYHRPNATSFRAYFNGENPKDTVALLRALAERLPALLKDGERLDAMPELIRGSNLFIYPNGVVGLQRGYPGPSRSSRTQTFATLREAIDAAQQPVDSGPRAASRSEASEPGEAK